MSEYDFLFEDDAGQYFEDGSSYLPDYLDPDDYVTIEVADMTRVGDEVKRPVIAHVGGRGGIHKTHTGFLRMVKDAVSRRVGNVHSYSENGGNVCEESPGNDTAEDPGSQHQQEPQDP